jgi:cellobiose epimerase
VVRDRIAVPPGALHLFFNPDWRPIPDHNSFGHDVETAFLLIEAAESLGIPDDPATLRMSRMLVDHALNWAFDPQGGLNEGGVALGPPTDRRKIWWSQVEMLNALLLMHERFGSETDRYWRAFQLQWRFIKANQIDPLHPGMYEIANPPADQPARFNKAHRWKAAYHDGRTYMLVGERLRKLAER